MPETFGMFPSQKGALCQADPGAAASLWEKQEAGSHHLWEKPTHSMVEEAWWRLGSKEDDWPPSTCQPPGLALQTEPEVTGCPEDSPPWRTPCLGSGEGDKWDKMKNIMMHIILIILPFSDIINLLFKLMVAIASSPSLLETAQIKIKW